MKYFTKPQIEEIRKQLATLGIRDTDLPNASELTGEEVIAIVQNGINKKVGIRDFFLRYMPENFLDRIVQGESAYDIWKSQPGNNDKTVEEFLESLKGKDGKNGTNGTNGTDGRTGAAAGFGTPIAEVDTTSSGQLGVSIQASGPDTAKIFRFIFHNLAQAVTPGGDDTTPGTPGRSVESIQLWFKLSTQGTNVNPPALSVADPSTTAGGGWSLQAGTPTEQQQYLWCFMQTNYSSNTDSGYPYSRSDAWISRRYNSDVSAEYSELQADLIRIESELRASIAGYVSDIQALYTSLNELSAQISSQILTDLNNVKNRLNAINQSDVNIIVRDGLFKALTSYKNSSDPGKKAFSDLVLDASKALATVNVGAEFFNGKTPQQIVSAGITLDGLLGAINMRATRAYVDSILTSDLLLEAGMLQSVIAKAHSCWKKDGLLYQYNIYWDTFWENYVEGEGSSSDDIDSGFYAYEQYMQKSAAEGGPAGDYLADLPAGPFELVVIADEFSAIKQSVDSVSSSVYGIGYMWENNTTGELVSYDYFQTQYDARDPEYTAYTYDNYVTNVITGYTKKATSTVLSNFTQTANSIKSTVGQVGYLWYKEASGGGYEYNAYVIPDDTTKSSYEAAMVAAGWTLINYAEKVSQINQTDEKIELAVLRAGKCWMSTTIGSGVNAVVPYDQWYDAYTTAVAGGYSGTYLDYVAAYHPNYELKDLDYMLTRLIQTDSDVSLQASRLGTAESQIGNLTVSANEIKMGVGLVLKIWKHPTTGDTKSYMAFYDEWYAEQTYVYETWVPMRKGYQLVELDAVDLAGLKISQDKIWAGIGDGTDVKASISIIGNLDTAENDSKIVLDADNVVVDGTLSAAIVNAGLLSAEELTITEGTNGSSIVAADGLIKFYDADGNLRLEIGQGADDDCPILKFYDVDDDENPLYDLGPNGITRLGDIVEMPEFEKYTLIRFANKPTVNSRFSDLVDAGGTNVTLYKYKDGSRIKRIGYGASEESVLQYYNPVTGEYQSSHSPLNDKLISGPTSKTVFTDGAFYVPGVWAWEQVSGSGYNVRAPLFDTRNGIQFEGYMYLNNTTRYIDAVIKVVYSQDEAS